MYMKADQLRLWLPDLCQLAQQAGEAIMAVYASEDFSIEKKGDGTPVTRADKAADAVIIAGLRQLTPDIPVVTEETLAEIPFEVRRDWRTCWLIDPLDGTREFIERTGEFSVNIALVEEGRPVLGVVYGPAMGALYFGGPAVDAWKQVGGQAVRIATKVSSQGSRVALSRRHGKKVDAFMAKLPPPVTQVHMGSALKTCLVTEGKADYYPRFGPTSYWDTAAAHAILRAAGGEVVDLYGAPLRYLPTKTLLNPFFIASGRMVSEALLSAARGVN